jgi:hypothetical protein
MKKFKIKEFMKIRILILIGFVFLIFAESCKKEKTIEAENTEEIVINGSQAIIWYTANRYFNPYKNWSTNFSITAEFHKESLAEGLPVSVGFVNFGAVALKAYEPSTGYFYYTLPAIGPKPDTANYLNLGKEVEISFGENIDANYKASKTKIYVPKFVDLKCNRSQDEEGIYYINRNSPLKVDWAVDSKFDSIYLQFYYDGFSNNDRNPELSDIDKTINLKVLNNGNCTIPNHVMDNFQKDSRIDIKIDLKTGKTVKLNGKVIWIICNSISGFGIELVN